MRRGHALLRVGPLWTVFHHLSLLYPSRPLDLRRLLPPLIESLRPQALPLTYPKCVGPIMFSDLNLLLTDVS